MKKPEKMTSDELLEELDDFYMKEDIVAMGVKDLLRTQACKSELIKREEEPGGCNSYQRAGRYGNG